MAVTPTTAPPTSTDTYKINANIQINDWLRFRGGYNKATRAPNLGELFLPCSRSSRGGGVYGDPCGLLSNSPFGAGGALPNHPTQRALPLTQLAARPDGWRARRAPTSSAARRWVLPASNQFYGQSQAAAGRAVVVASPG